MMTNYCINVKIEFLDNKNKIININNGILLYLRRMLLRNSSVVASLVAILDFENSTRPAIQLNIMVKSMTIEKCKQLL
jgi:hypothetical protein